MRKPLGLLAALVLLAAACQGRGQNALDVYKAADSSLISGPTVFEVNVPPDQGNVTAVQYFLNDTPIGTSTEGPTFPLTFDTRTVANAVHNLKALGNPGQGDVVLLNVSIMVQNAAGATPGPPTAFKGTRR
ncbi:MAG: Ig-like domain-containing protein [Candidatus Sericytochromatia bacterium]|nr:Ig-like domain-containing protein [Candidatus Sericytochromatia bacterium]